MPSASPNETRVTRNSIASTICRPNCRRNAYAGGGLGSIGDGPRFSRSLLVAAVLLALGLAFVYSAQQKRRVAETVELDTQLLSDELPIDAYLDKGFEAWLKKHRQH